MIAGCQSLEIGYYFGQWTGTILRNMIQFAFHPGPAWISTAVTRVRVPPGGSATIVARLDATGLGSGSYASSLRIVSNDPKAPELRLPVTLDVASAPDIGVAGALITARSSQPFGSFGALTFHPLTAVPAPAGEGELELRAEGDFSGPIPTATATAEEIRLGQVGGAVLRCAIADSTFPILAGNLAKLVA